jgi:transposase
MKEQIEKLRTQQGLSIRKIAQALDIHRNTVRKCLPEGDPHKKDPQTSQEAPETWDQTIDWNEVHLEVGKGVGLNILHQEIAPEVPYIRFWRSYHRLFPKTPEATLVLKHKPGEKVHIDYTDGISIFDPKTGKETKTQLFVGTMAFSSYFYAEFCLDQKQATFLKAQENMWKFFGGATPYLIVDNLKSGVTKAHLYDPDVNPTYCDFANHYNFAVLPARPYTPRDKAPVESSNNFIQQGFYQEFRHRKFTSLFELNRTFHQWMEKAQHKVMKDHGLSRWERFQKEKELLKELPNTPFEITEWRSAKVHPDCHIQVQKNFYSVPFHYIAQIVRVRLTQNTLEVFNQDHESIACHVRRYGKHQYATHNAHYPEQKLSLALFDVKQAQRKANEIGEKTSKLVQQLLAGEHPLKYLRRSQGILRLSRKYSKASLEYACDMALKFKRPRLNYIQDCAQHFEKNGNRPRLTAPHRDPNTLHLTEQVKSLTHQNTYERK